MHANRKGPLPAINVANALSSAPVHQRLLIIDRITNKHTILCVFGTNTQYKQDLSPEINPKIILVCCL